MIQFQQLSGVGDQVVTDIYSLMKMISKKEDIDQYRSLNAIMAMFSQHAHACTMVKSCSSEGLHLRINFLLFCIVHKDLQMFFRNVQIFLGKRRCGGDNECDFLSMDLSTSDLALK